MDIDARIKPFRDRRRIERHRRAWARFAPDGDCPYCGHTFAEHALGVGQPHFFRPATDAERSDPSVQTYRGRGNEDDDGRYRRVVVSKYAEVIVACCFTCADAIGSEQAICYQAKAAIGELVGVQPAS